MSLQIFTCKLNQIYKREFNQNWQESGMKNQRLLLTETSAYYYHINLIANEHRISNGLCKVTFTMEHYMLSLYSTTKNIVNTVD